MSERDVENKSALGSPVSISLGGKEYFLSPLTPSDFGRLREYVRKLALDDVRSPMLALNETFKQLSPEVQAIMAREAMAQASGAKTAEPTQEAIREKLTSLDGIRFMFWLSAKKLQPSMTREDATAAVGEDDRYEVMDRITKTEAPEETGDPKAS